MRSFDPQALMNSSRSQFQGLLQGLTGAGGQAHASPLLAGAGFNFQQMSSLLTPASMVRRLAAGTLQTGLLEPGINRACCGCRARCLTSWRQGGTFPCPGTLPPTPSSLRIPLTPSGTSEPPRGLLLHACAIPATDESRGVRCRVCLPHVVSRCTKVPAVILGPQVGAAALRLCRG